MKRAIEQKRQHYLLEKELAEKLKNAPKEQRRKLYPLVYDELFSKLPDHKQFHGGKSDALQEKNKIKRLIRLLDGQGLLQKTYNYLEVGPGNCHLAYEVARHVKRVHAVDVSATLSEGCNTPDNFELIISDGISIPVPIDSIDVVFSNQLMEHLHPDDAIDQLGEIHNALRSDGVYLCVTPNRLSGPHDISRHFDKVATCFHLKEYTMCELVEIFKKAGFTRIYCLIGGNGYNIRVPIFFNIFLEKILLFLPNDFSSKISKIKIIKILLAIKLLAIKS